MFGIVLYTCIISICMEQLPSLHLRCNDYLWSPSCVEKKNRDYKPQDQGSREGMISVQTSGYVWGVWTSVVMFQDYWLQAAFNPTNSTFKGVWSFFMYLAEFTIAPRSSRSVPKDNQKFFCRWLYFELFHLRRYWMSIFHALPFLGRNDGTTFCPPSQYS